jgi:phage terminase large subunit-like protein
MATVAKAAAQKNTSKRAPRRKLNPVTAYAEAVSKKKISAGPIVRDACARHLRDLQEGHKRGITFDVAAAMRAIGFFADVLRLNGGKFEGAPYELLSWQAFIVGSLFGWKAADGFRRFRVGYVETGKGSGKSPLAAGIGLYGLVADGEDRAEIYTAATKKDQALILFRDAVAMVDLSPELDGRIVRSGAKGKEWNLAYHQNNAFFRAIASDDSQSGPRPHMALLDEIHEHRDAIMVEMMRAGTKGRDQALIFMITNSGTNKNSVCWNYHEYARKVCAGLEEDDSFFGYVCALDELDDPLKDESCWMKANPSLGVTIQKKYLQEQVTQARGMPAKESMVRRLNFCQWVESLSPWISSHVWLPAGDTDFDQSLLRHRKCWGGLDLSSVHDLTAFVLAFEPIEQDSVWRLLPYFWLPSDGLADKAHKDQVPYIAWRDAGWLRTTPGKAISKLHVLHELSEICAQFDVQSIGYDLWRIEDLKTQQAEEGISLPPLEGFGQGYKSMAPALDEFERRLLNSLLKHNGNPVLTSNAANAVVETDPAGNRKIAKHKATGRVDGIVAAIMATGRSMGSTENNTSVYETRGMLTL